MIFVHSLSGRHRCAEECMECHSCYNYAHYMCNYRTSKHCDGHKIVWEFR